MKLSDVKKIIVDYEYYKNGFHKLINCDVKVVNLKKVDENYECDVILYTNNHTERFDYCTYPIEMIEKMVVKK